VTCVCRTLCGRPGTEEKSDSKIALAVFALAAYTLFALIAFWLDKKRI